MNTQANLAARSISMQFQLEQTAALGAETVNGENAACVLLEWIM